MANLFKRMSINQEIYRFFVYNMFKKKKYLSHFFKHIIYKKFYISHQFFLKGDMKKIYDKFIFDVLMFLLKKFIIKKIDSKKKLISGQRFFDCIKMHYFFFCVCTNVLKKNYFIWTKKLFSLFFLLQINLGLKSKKNFLNYNFFKRLCLKKKIDLKKLSPFYKQIKLQLIFICLNYNNLNISLRIFTKNSQSIFKLVKISVSSYCVNKK